MKSHKDLEVWKRSVAFVTEIYKITKTYPSDEKYGIVNQMRRSAVSIPSNISEGAARNHPKEYMHFLYVSLGSLAELETQLIISNNLNYINHNNFEILNKEIMEIKNMLLGLIRYLSK
jgi:four helix bundle protein